MKFNRFFALASVFVGGGGLLMACSSRDVDTQTGAGGIAGAGGSTGGKGGAGGSSAGAAGAETGGTGGAEGGAAGSATGGTAGAAGAGGQCLGDTGQADVDGGWGSLCDTLPYAGDCSGDAPGEFLCRYMV